MIGLFIFIFGIIFGSFLNVCIYRIPQNISIIKPSSRCPICKTPIKWYDNIPIISYIFLKGRCRYCKTKISIRYPLVELLGGVVAFLLYKKFGFSIDFVFLVIFSYGLLILSFIDFDFFIIPDKINIFLLIFGILYAILSKDILNSIISGILGFLIFYLVSILFSKLLKQEALGFGDVKFLGVIGIWIGWKGGLFTIFVASFIGSIIGILLILISSKGLKTKIPFGPFLAVSAFLYIFIGKQLMHFFYGV